MSPRSRRVELEVGRRTYTVRGAYRVESPPIDPLVLLARAHDGKPILAPRGTGTVQLEPGGEVFELEDVEVLPLADGIRIRARVTPEAAARLELGPDLGTDLR